MERSNYHISLDIQDSHSGVLLNMKQHDTHRRICITLTDGGRPYALREGCYGVFTAKKPDGTAIFNDCAIAGDTLIYDVTRQTTAEAGELACEVRLYGGDDKLLTCAAFGILVCPAVVSDDDDIASMPEATTLSRLLDRVEKVEDFMDESVLGGKAWSAKKLIDTLCPPFSQTGSVVTCHPVEGYPLTLEAEGEITHCGKNLTPQPYNRDTTAMAGAKFTVNPDYSVTVDTDDAGTTGLATFVLMGKGTGTNAQLLSQMGLEPGDAVTMSLGVQLPEGVTVENYFYNEQNSSLVSNKITNAKTFTIPVSAARIYSYIRITTGTVLKGLTLYPMLEKGNTATGYAPYRSEKVEPGEVCAYAGKNTFIAESGDLTVTGRKDIISMLEEMENGN